MRDLSGYVIVTGVVAVLLYGLNGILTPDPSVRNLEVFTEMAYSKAYESFTSSTHLAGGWTQQPLVEGVVPRGYTPLHFGLGTEEAERAGRILVNPFGDDDAAALERGALVFTRTCALCHGADGEGQGPVIQHGMGAPPSLHGARAVGMADGQLFHVVEKGQGRMAGLAGQLSSEDRWKVVLHVRRMQQEASK